LPLLPVIDRGARQMPFYGPKPSELSCGRWLIASARIEFKTGRDWADGACRSVEIEGGAEGNNGRVF